MPGHKLALCGNHSISHCGTCHIQGLKMKLLLTQPQQTGPETVNAEKGDERHSWGGRDTADETREAKL